MATLVATDEVYIEEVEPWAIVTIITEPDDSKIERSNRVLEPPEVAPKKPSIITSTKSEQQNTTADFKQFNLPEVEVDVSSSTIEFDPNFLKDSDAVPVFRTLPVYPVKAAREKLKGWVKLSFDVNRFGEIENIHVVDSKPKGIFEQAAIDALGRWKYKAKIEQGKTVRQIGLIVRLSFGKK